MRRMRYGSQHLCRPNIGAPEHSDLATGIRQSSGPFNRVVAILRLMEEGIPLSFGAEAPAHILKDDHVSLLRRSNTEANSVVLVVGSPLQQYWILSRSNGTINIC